MNKAVLITGACINTGVSIVEKFASVDWDVIFTGRDLEKVHAAKRMKENGGGNMVFVNSNTAYRVIPDRIAYSASKKRSARYDACACI